ncbi:hypothetical protein BDZ90DRAFT_230972 [Jaminaea rosea]|uniref:GAR domain-containing protein n=1 Tax=Jaminaea rosea TaxID=1569628 RepID=A0A316UVD2_9BASI|nr:hypothetical protein BDZ90DRAFT_230972 [Jaminaea rosea]PWN28974.1 hypothetical protein BDZ90DRAFT_230972 [Jaminaea rosea]
MTAVVAASASGMASSEQDSAASASLEDPTPSPSCGASHDTTNDDEVSHDTLTREEAFELGRFSEGKARIDEHLQLLESRSTIDAFADFKPSWEAMTMGDIEQQWAPLDARREEAANWIEERDGIEETTLRFDAADMERLRKLAKACSQRNMSREDTDIVEVALQTLVALEGLRVALSSRERRLSLLDARLAWETARRDCCTLYRPLADDVDDFVSQQARWSMPTQRSPAATFSDVAERAERIASRIANFVDVIVPRSSEALDEVIEQCQAPEAFLDEQDRIEDLAVSLTSRLQFVKELLSQWRAAEELLRQTTALCKAGRDLLALIENLRTKKPSVSEAASIKEQSDTLRHELLELGDREDIIKFLVSPEKAASGLHFCPVKHSLPSPRHEHWSDQADIDGKIQSALRTQLVETATNVRRAIEASKAFLAAYEALERAAKLQKKVQKSSDECHHIAAIARAGWTAEEHEKHWSELLRELLRPSRPAQEALAKADTIPQLQSRLGDTIAETDAWCASISELHLTCRSLDMYPAVCEKEAAEVASAWRTASENARLALADASALRDALRHLHELSDAHDVAQPALQRLREGLLDDISHHTFEISKLQEDNADAHRSPRHGSELAGVEAYVSKYTACLDLVKKNRLIASTAQNDATLTSRHADEIKNLEDVRSLLRWAQALFDQRKSVLKQQQRFNELDKQGADLRIAASVGELAESDLDTLAKRLSPLAEDIVRFKAGQQAGLQLVGNPNALHTPASPPLTSPDGAVRDVSHAWCLRLDQLQDEIWRLMNDARERNRLCKEQQEEEERKRQAIIEAEARARAEQEAALAEVKAKAEAAALAATKAAAEAREAEAQAEAEAEARAREMEERAKIEDEQARANADRERREEEERRRADEEARRRADEEKARVEAAEEDARLKAAAEARQRQAKADAEDLAARAAVAPEKVYKALEQARQAAESCYSHIGSRDRAFKKVLGSANSRRLPQRAFLSELSSRRTAAENALIARRDVFDSKMRALTDYLDVLPEDDEYDVMREEAEATRQKVRDDIARLLQGFDDAIAAEGGESSVTSSNSSSFESSPVGSTATPRRRLDSLGSARSLPASPLTPTVPLPDDLRRRSEYLKRVLQPGEVEVQVIPEHGKKQSEMLLDLPSAADAERVGEATASLLKELGELRVGHPTERGIASLVDQAQTRATRLRRYKQLADFNTAFVTMETALGEFLTLLDDAEGQGLDRFAPSPMSGSRPSSRRSTRALTPAQDASQTVQTQLSSLDPLMEAADSLAKPVAQDVRVRDRLEQLRKSYVDMAEMARDVLNPDPDRSLSAMSRTTSDCSLSTINTPLLGTLRLPQIGGDNEDDSSSVLATPTKIPRPRSSTAGRFGERAHVSSRLRTTSLTAQASAIDSNLPRLRAPSTPQRPPVAIEGRRSSAGQVTPLSRSVARQRLPAIAGSPASTPPRVLGTSRTVDSTPTSRPRTTSAKQSAPPLPSAIRVPSSASKVWTPARRPRATTAAAVSTPSNMGKVAEASSSSSRPNRYKANPKSRLDIAVAKVVNRMPMPVSMVHASQVPGGRPRLSNNGVGIVGTRSVSSSTDSTTGRREEWKDDSGRYWVGHPDPKLCFCRILRSRTIMVRIGGGWQELTRYLIQHYGLSVPGIGSGTDGEGMTQGAPSSLPSSSSLSRFAAADGAGGSAMPWISSASVKEHSRVPSSSSATSVTSAMKGRRTASTATTASGGISSPILFNLDGSPQEYFGMSPRTPTGKHRQRTVSLQGGSPTSKQAQVAAERGGGSPTAPPVPPLPLAVDVERVSPTLLRKKDGASTSPLIPFSVQHERRGSTSRAGRDGELHAFQLKAPAQGASPSVAATPGSPGPPSSWRRGRFPSSSSTSAMRSPPSVSRADGLAASTSAFFDSSPTKTARREGAASALPASESTSSGMVAGEDILPLFFRKEEQSTPADHRAATAARSPTPTSGRKSAGAVMRRETSEGARSSASGSRAKTPTS